MADYKNIELTDDMMVDAAGGGNGNTPSPKYHPGQKVILLDEPDMGLFTIVSVGSYYSPKDGWLYNLKSLVGSETFPYWENNLKAVL